MPQSLGMGLYGITCVSAAGGIFLALSGKKGKFTSLFRFFLSLVLILLLLSPLHGLVASAKTLIDGYEAPPLPEERAGEMTLAYAKETAERDLAVILSRKTGIPVTDITVLTELDTEDMSSVTVESVTVTLADHRYRISSAEIEKTVSELLSFHKDGAQPGTVYSRLSPENIEK